MIIELTRVKVKKGKTERVTEWLKMLNETIDIQIPILDEEKMYVECIFREFRDEIEYLYWFDLRGEGGRHISQSPHEVDKKHLEYWHECIEEHDELNIKNRIDLKPEVILISDKIKSLIK